MISLKDLRKTVKMMEKQYIIADKLLNHIDENASINIEIPDVSIMEIEDVHLMLKDLKLIQSVKPVYTDDSIPPMPEPRLTNEGRNALKKGMKKYIKSKNCTIRLIWAAFAILFISAILASIKTLFS